MKSLVPESGILSKKVEKLMLLKQLSITVVDLSSTASLTDSKRLHLGWFHFGSFNQNATNFEMCGHISSCR